MKKLLTTLFIALLLVGCSNASVSPKENSVLFTVNGISVDEKQYFEVMKLRDAGRLTVLEAQRVLTDAVENAEVDKEAQEELNKAKEYMEAMGQSFEDYLKSVGMESEQKYLEELIYPTYRLNYLIKEAITADFDTLATTYAPKQMRILETETYDNGTKALERIKAGEKFEDVAKDLKREDSSYDGSLKIYNIKDTEFPTEISSFVSTQASPGLSDVFKNESTGVSYIVEVVETQADRFKDELLETWVGDQNLTKKYKADLFKNAKFKVYDIDILNALKADSSTADYLSQ